MLHREFESHIQLQILYNLTEGAAQDPRFRGDDGMVFNFRRQVSARGSGFPFSLN